MQIGHDSICVGQTQYRLAEILGVGANGVVWKATADSKIPIAIKFYEPWTVKLKYADHERDTLDKIFGVVKQFKEFRIEKKLSYAKIHRFSASPSALINILMDKGVHATPYQHKRGICLSYRIACCVEPIPIGNGAILMPLLGKSLVGACPIDSVISRACISHVIKTACISALAQNRALPDIKPGNICRDGKNFLLIDVDDLPYITENDAENWATFTIPELKGNIIATMLANAVLTVAQIYGNITEWYAVHFFHHSSKAERSVSTLADLATEDWKHVVDVISDETTKTIALDTLSYNYSHTLM